MENDHSTDVESPAYFRRIGVSVQPEGKSCTDPIGVLVLNDPPAWLRRRLRRAAAGRGRGVIENKHSTDVAYSPPPLRRVTENKHLADVESPPPPPPPVYPARLCEYPP
jgi:hypothetical protein